MKHNGTGIKAAWLSGLWLAATLVFAGAAAAAEKTPPVVIVEQGTQKVLRAETNITRIAVGNPAVADVSLVNRRDLLTTGKSIGITSLLVWVQGKTDPRRYVLRVQLPVDPLKAQRVDPELKAATIDPGRGVGGQLPNLLAHRRAQLAASAQKEGAIADSSSVELESQVLTEVKIAEVSRSTAQQYGLGLGYKHVGKKTSVDWNAPARSAGVVESAFNLVFNRDVGNGNSITGVLDVLESRGLARVLAEPSLSAMSGQTATFLAGGEFPVPISQGGGSGSSSAITVEYKEFGIRLSLTPTVLARNRIALRIAPEVSDLDFSGGIQVGGVAVPALTVRRTDTAIELGDGESFVIAGLVSSNLVDNVNKLPWLGDIPILGAFFKNNDLSRTDKELIMVVTPRLVRPLARGVALPRLPGAQYDGKTPGIAHTIFVERGNFDSGFSR